MTTLIILIALSIILDLLILYNRDKAFAQKPGRYHVEVPNDYWGRVFGDKWYDSTDDEKLQIRNDHLTELMERLLKEGTVTAIISESWIDSIGERVGLTITRLDKQEPTNPYQWLIGQFIDWAQLGRAYLKRRFARTPISTKTYFRLASPDASQNPEGFFWWVVAILLTLFSISLTGLFLVSCGKPDKPAQTRPTTVPRDITRERLQTEHTANLDTLKVKKERTSSTQKPYETAVSQFDSLRDRLPR